MIIKNMNTNSNIRMEEEQMEHQEKRFRLKYLDESGVSITTNENKAYWQNAHYHRGGNELYAIQKGRIIVAIQDDKEITYKILKNNDSIMINQGVKHNLFLFPNTVIFNMKFGNIVPNDWNEAKWLNIQCRKLDIKKMMLLKSETLEIPG